MPEKKPPGPLNPGTVALGHALQGSAPLAQLMHRLRESNERFDLICPLLPDPLRQQLRAGPLDDKGWTLLASNGAAASKLRQLLPQLEQALRARGREVTAIRIKVQSG